MKSLSTTLAPAASPTARADLPAIMSSVKPAGLLTIGQTRARILYVDCDNRRDECRGAMISVLARIARIQPFPHGGINE